MFWALTVWIPEVTSTKIGLGLAIALCFGARDCCRTIGATMMVSKTNRGQCGATKGEQRAVERTYSHDVDNAGRAICTTDQGGSVRN